MNRFIEGNTTASTPEDYQGPCQVYGGSIMGELDEKWLRRFRAYRKHLRLKEQALAYKGGRCVICGYDRCPAALHFHFADVGDREFYISSASSWEKMQVALDRCTLLCANCRTEARAGWHPQHLVLEDARY